MRPHPILVGITGATGAIYGIELLRALRSLARPAHLVISEMGLRTLAIETDVSADEVRALADQTYSNRDLAAAVSGGSFRTAGMVIAPCSIKTLSGIANAFGHNLMIRAADVTLKERRPLVLLVRETPLHLGHLRLMTLAAEMGAVIMPPVPAFYHRPAGIDDIVRHTVARALDHLGLDHDLVRRWSGPEAEAPSGAAGEE